MKTLKNKRQKRDSLDVLYGKRDRALEGVVAVFQKEEGIDGEELNRALDVLTLAHVAVNSMTSQTDATFNEHDMTDEQWLAARKEEGLKIDPDNAEVHW